jgi:alpha,alpha-trehalase
LWAGCAANIRLKKISEVALQFIRRDYRKYKSSIAGIPEDVPQRQWDYPFGWSASSNVVMERFN